MSPLALIKGNKNDNQGEGAAKRSALIKSYPTENTVSVNQPKESSENGEFTSMPEPKPSASTGKTLGGSLGSFFRSASKTVRSNPLLESAPEFKPEPRKHEQSHTSDSEEFRPQAAPQKAVIVGKVLGAKKGDETSPILPSLAKSKIVVPTDDPLPDDQPKPPPPITVDQVIIDEAKAKAADIVAAAEKAAADKLEKADISIKQFNEKAALDAAKSKEEAYALGLKEGTLEGNKVGRQEFVKLMIQARDLYEQAIRERQKLLVDTEPELARLAIGIAEKIIGLEISTTGEVVMGVVRQALANIKDREQVVIRVSPDDYHIVNADRTALLRMVDGLKDFDLSIDSSVEAGGCIIETNLGNIDARLSTQLHAIDVAFERSISGQEDSDGSDPD